MEPEDISEEVLQKELSELREAASSQEKEIQTNLEQMKRLQADFENFRRRMEREKLWLAENASRALVGKLLPILDNFELAFKAVEASSDLKAFKEGMGMVYRQFMDLLSAEGLTPIEAVGEPFDPKLHEAIAYETRREGEDHLVLEEARKGYKFKGEILRPAMVKVAKKTQEADVKNG